VLCGEDVFAVRHWIRITGRAVFTTKYFPRINSFNTILIEIQFNILTHRKDETNAFGRNWRALPIG
jgi:hypothetical protein